MILASLRDVGSAFRGFQPDGAATALDTLADERTEVLGYDAYHLVDPLMTQPLQVVLAGRRGNTGSYESGMRLWHMAPDPVDLMVTEGAGHYEMYDEPEYVEAAAARLADFYRSHL